MRLSFVSLPSILTKMKVTIIGSGNVASWMAYILNKNAVCVNQVYGRNPATAAQVAALCHAEPVSCLADLRPDSDYYIFSLKDDAYGEVLSAMPFTMPCAVHTAGSLPQSVLESCARHYGVMYPFQTISKTADFEQLKVPLCIEGKDEESLRLIRHLACQLSPQVNEMDGGQRAVLHVAAVFACNFSNALYDMAYQLLTSAGIDWQVMLPLLQQTIDKTASMTPKKAQTGPAVRNDKSIMEKHLQRLPSEEMRQVYKMLSDYIIKRK